MRLSIPDFEKAERCFWFSGESHKPDSTRPGSLTPILTGLNEAVWLGIAFRGRPEQLYLGLALIYKNDIKGISVGPRGGYDLAFP